VNNDSVCDDHGGSNEQNEGVGREQTVKQSDGETVNGGAVVNE